MPTMYKNNSRFSSKINGCSPHQICNGLKVESPAVGYYSYTRPLWFIAKKNKA